MGRRDRILAPIERLSEILFGLIMALTVTGAVSVTAADRLQIQTMVIAALGCNIAWGIIDAGMYLMGRLAERGHTLMAAKAIRDTSDAEKAHRIIADELPTSLASIFLPAQLEFIRQRVAQMSFSRGPRLTARDYVGAACVCMLVILSTFPVVIPFIFIQDTRLALRISNAIAVISLFVCGFLFGRYVGLRPWTTGLVMVAVGIALVGIAMALGG